MFSASNHYFALDLDLDLDQDQDPYQDPDQDQDQHQHLDTDQDLDPDLDHFCFLPLIILNSYQQIYLHQVDVLMIYDEE